MERLPAVKLGALDLDSWPDDFGGEFTSPLSLLSPNAWHRVGLSPARSKPANGAALATAALGAAPPPPPLPEEENKALAVLPQFGARGGKGHAASRRPDARRQSLAIGAMFAGLSSGAGLLGDSELAVGGAVLVGWVSNAGGVGGQVGGWQAVLLRCVVVCSRSIDGSRVMDV